MADHSLFRTLCPSEVLEFTAAARKASEGLSYAELAEQAAHETYHPVYRKEIARHLLFRLETLSDLYIMREEEVNRRA